MKVYISADLEGLNGVTNHEQTVASGGLQYENTRKQLHKELKAVISGLKKAEVTSITINDAHMSMDNILLSELPEDVELISGKPKPISMMYGLDESYDCVFLFGYHAKADSKEGVLAHTFTHSFKKVILNGKAIGEADLNSIYAGRKNVPIAFASGDDVFCEQIKNDIGKITTVTTKKAISFNAAKCKTNAELLKELEDAAFNAVKDTERHVLYQVNAPFKLEVEFKSPNVPVVCSFLPNVKKNGSYGVEFTSDDFDEVYKFLQFLSAAF